jgi:hypothetical protein
MSSLDTVSEFGIVGLGLMATNFECNTDKNRHFMQGRDVLHSGVHHVDWKEKDAA